MISLWCVIGLIAATISVSTLGATFSVVGLAALFSGASLAVSAMAASLELAKFILAAYLHQRWTELNIIFKAYLVAAIIILSAITSLGIFGFLSNAYQSASAALEAESVKSESLKAQQAHNQAEISRLTRSIDEIPANRISKRIEVRKEIEPAIAALTKQTQQLESLMTQSNLRTLELKNKVGPLIYIAKAFKLDIDTVVKYLILLLVSVFDPLAICLVIATSGALETRRRGVAASPPPSGIEDEVIQMRFVDDKDQSTG
ncbi:MAG TPA: hypothetical protein VIG33_13960 [Pseudobdellovibrionaceae bacterium]|jgi:hypothetical protein